MVYLMWVELVVVFSLCSSFSDLSYSVCTMYFSCIVLYQRNWLQILVHVKCNLYVTCSFVFVVLFITLYKVALTFESVNEILKCDHSNESY